jgi:hypothetical protein
MPKPKRSTRGGEQHINIYRLWACATTIGFLWSMTRGHDGVSSIMFTKIDSQRMLEHAEGSGVIDLTETTTGSQNSTTATTCPQHGTTQLSHVTEDGKIILSKLAIQNHSKQKLKDVIKFTDPVYEQFMMSDPGTEHYILWSYLTQKYHAADDCRHVVDIGTRYAASALALGASGVKVKTFDIPNSSERHSAFRGKSEQDWQNELKGGPGVHIEFHNIDLLKIPDPEFYSYFSTWLIVLDTFHEPYTVPFEREFTSRLINVPEPHKFKGLMLLDDIHLNPEMEKWWQELNDNANQWGYTAHDLTSVGHYSGTGLLDFSGKVLIAD